MQVGPYLPRHVPEPIQGLIKLALDLRWSWHHGSDRLWRAIDTELWNATQNPWLILNTVSDQRLAELARDTEFLALLGHQLAVQEAHFQEATWFSDHYPKGLAEQDPTNLAEHVAYFCMEYGLTESLPIYSGGLGVLAGDFLKTCSDLGVPAVGIGLLYQQGYFRQALNAHGEQIEFYPYNDPTMLPVAPLRDDQGEWISVVIHLPGRPLRLRTWHGRVGRRSLLLLDSNDPRNEPGDRGITSELYGGSVEKRLQQEMVLGFGGWRLLDMLNIQCTLCHINEGHAAFAILERTRATMKRLGVSFDVALRATRIGNLFTTHTAVDAGFDRFPPDLISLYLRDYADSVELPMERLLGLGRVRPDDAQEPFNMAFLALRGTGAINAVSRLHRTVSQQLFLPLFPRWPCHEAPIDYVTNGVHTPSWDSVDADRLWTEACGKARWKGTQESLEQNLRTVADEPLWQIRTAQRSRLVDFLRHRLIRQHCERGEGEDRGRHCGLLLDKDTLTLGFARRFAEYKRPDLLLQDPERLIKLLNHRDHPLQLVIAGKAHPRDSHGKRMLQRWFEFIQQPVVEGRVVLIEDYDLLVGAAMTQGVDVWLNTPRRPWEACGTSGMKTLVNGGLNLSELDGWWAEAYDPELGWALGDLDEHRDTSGWDAVEANQLYCLLEQQVVPLFYRRDEHGIPREWIRMMRESMARLTPEYSGNRMVREYVEKFYLPMSRQVAERSVEVARDIERWHDQLKEQWHLLHFGNVTAVRQNEYFLFRVQVYLDGIEPDAVRVELYADLDGGRSCITTELTRTEALAGFGHAYNYQGLVPADRPLEDYTPRVLPFHPNASVPLEAPFVLWFR